ncbi:hypothetical protein LTR08_003135 [Meristemomyces frigidus]|nr:hypothetical protein LTR08_003135 [Meristemomyces frigidus]
MAPQTLTDLPSELQLAVVELIRRPSDLRNLCLASKALRAVAVPELYGEVVLDLDRCTFRHLHGYFFAGNPGPKYVRSLQFIPDKPKDYDDAVRVMRLALHMVDRNGLRKISMPQGMVLDDGFLTQLCVGQQQLSTLHLGVVGNAVFQLMTSPVFPRHWCRTITSLHIPELMSSLDDLEGYQQIIRHASALRDLHIWMNGAVLQCDGTIRLAPNTFKDDYGSLQDGMLIKLFGPVQDEQKQPKLNLSRLRLARVEMFHPETSLMRVIDFSKLTELALVGCPRPEILLMALARDFERTGSALRKFTFTGFLITATPLEALLGSVTGLSSLHLSYNSPDAKKFPDRKVLSLVCCLKNHCFTLRELYVDYRMLSMPKGSDDRAANGSLP